MRRWESAGAPASEPADAPLTAGEWARVPSEWFAARRDIFRGYAARFDLASITMKAIACLLTVYSVYLLYCESCKDEYYAFARALIAALSDATFAQRGSVSAAALVLAASVWLLTVLWMRRRPEVLLVDFKTYRHASVGGDPRNTAGEPVAYDRFLAESRAARHLDGGECFTAKSLQFQEKILRTSSISERSLFPPSIFREEVGQDAVLAERDSLCMRGAREEAECMMFNAVEQLLEATHVAPHEVSILVVNCSLFCPTPSLSAMLVNHFKMRSDCLTYNLGGMGCSAGGISIDLARRLLRGHEQKGSLALVVSTENITQNWYRGNDRGMLLQNTLFRCGAAAILLSNRGSDAGRARFKLLHTVRTHVGKDDLAYNSVIQEEDADGIRGVRLSKAIMQIAGDALKRNITALGPLVLPLKEQLKFFFNMVARTAARGKAGKPVKSLARSLVPLPLFRSLVNFTPDPADQPLPSPKPAARAAGN